MWLQRRIQLAAKPRGFHLVTREICGQLPELDRIEVGLAHFFLQHTSASLAINENADADVCRDLESYFSRAVAENEPYYRHTLEGPDDMPAHIKTVILGSSLSIPVSDGQLALGIWQGIYLCEHRNHAGSRSVIVTLHGE
ncbi:secondary thiamine-phosphate synthase enzyme YjbQ [Methylomonas koyamae]|uniref:secondary thiamine-phosphate synthase enzyme YjbQ n=1 Tax=Methylomonas koyamae TaxID=702114 RepID=UPI002872B3D4|nr:secondary thiamine-phosphate synthase enzyme YjbQ [Methylomonas koyamae]WNB76176.1 secondary thiamine-phosphate synthase enzyme YjbQ [Methylomonas koyamae]